MSKRQLKGRPLWAARSLETLIFLKIPQEKTTNEEEEKRVRCDGRSVSVDLPVLDLPGAIASKHAANSGNRLTAHRRDQSGHATRLLQLGTGRRACRTRRERAVRNFTGASRLVQHE